MTHTTLNVNSNRDAASQIAELSNSGQSWSNHSKSLRGTPSYSFNTNNDDVSGDYWIYSYSTVIAWHDADGWHRNPRKYSVTTSKHQGKLYLLDGAS